MIQPESSSAWFMTGWARNTDNRCDSAIKDLQRAVVLDPNNDDSATMLRHLSGGD